MIIKKSTLYLFEGIHSTVLVFIFPFLLLSNAVAELVSIYQHLEYAQVSLKLEYLSLSSFKVVI